MNETIIDAPAEVTAYLDQIRNLADAKRDALGFLPATAYEEAATKGCLWVAVEGSAKKLRGYLFFGVRFPRLRVYQVYVCPEFRSSGTARTLIEKLKSYGEDHDYLTITARVASDLPANGFWRNLGFNIIGRQSGGSRGRTINRYALALDVPSLFGRGQPVSEGTEQTLHVRPVLETRSYVIDLNVLFDVLRDRDQGEAIRVLSMGFDSDMRLAVTSEFTRELERRSPRSNDPVLKLARALPTLPQPRQEVLNPLVGDLRRQGLSTGSPKTGRRAANDASDLIHLASCIHHRVYGFITRDGSILQRAEELHAKYNLRIISPADLWEPFKDLGIRRERMTAVVGQQEIEIAAFDERDRTKVERFLRAVGIPVGDISTCLAPGTTVFPKTISVVRTGQRILGIGSWADRPGAGRESVARLYVDEDSQYVDRTVDHLLEHSIVFGYRVGARKSAKWCAASCAGADTWSMARGSGRGGGSKAPRREQEPRDKRIEELQRENVKLNEDLVRTIRDRDRWKRRSEHLEKQLDAARRAGRRQAAPFAKDRRQGRGGRPGRRPGAGYGRQGRRRRPPRVDETHAARVPKACPACGGAVEVARVAAQYQEDLPPVHPIVRRFDIEVGHCSQCRRRVQGRHRLQTSDALGAASVQLGPGAVSLAVELHTELGVPLAKVAHVLRTRFGVHVTPGGLARLLHRAARDAGPAYRELCRQVRNAPVVTPDETGWRVGAKPHWLWTCVTPETTVYAICPGRSFDDAATLLGTDYSGVLVRDGWVVYRCYKGLHQSCINHLANRCRKLREGHPRSPWGPAVLAVLRAGLAARDRCNAGEMSEHGLASVRGRLEARLGRLIDAPPRIPDAQRFANHLATEFPAVFLFLRDPSIDATNWRAEQAIRPAVVIRKVCGGNRTRQGADTQQVLSSVVRTARQRGLDLPRLITEMLRAREPVVPEAFGLPPPPA